MLEQDAKHVLVRFYKTEATYMKTQPSEGPADFSEMRKTLLPLYHPVPDQSTHAGLSHGAGCDGEGWRHHGFRPFY